jgi:hypothetical protein
VKLRHACALVVCASLLAACGGGSGGGQGTAAEPATVPEASLCDKPGPSSLAAAECASNGLASLDPAFSASFKAPKRNEADAGRECESAAQIVFYAQDDWLRLAQKLAANPYECAEYYISVPPTEDADGLFTVPNRGQAERIRALGDRFHAMAAVRVDAWTQWRQSHPGTSWEEIGAEYRRRMKEAGYDVAAGDLWAVNELPLSVATDARIRANMLDLVSGLAGGGGAPVKGLVFVVSPEQAAGDLEAYRADLLRFARDEPFWTAMAQNVRLWAQEVYANPGSCCVPGADAATRIARLNEYLQHLRDLVEADPRAVAARTFLREAYLPLGNAAWSWTAAYGDTDIPVGDMARFVAQQVEAMRSAAGSAHRSPAGLGFAWAPLQPAGTSQPKFAEETGRLLDSIAAAIARTFRENDPSAACQPTGCDCTVEGASFNDGWAAFVRRG